MKTGNFRRLIDLREACARCGGISTTTYYRAAARGELPRPVKITPRRSGIDEEALDAALEKRIEAAEK